MAEESYELKLFELSKIAKSVLEGEDDTQKVHFSKTMLNILRDSLGPNTSGMDEDHTDQPELGSEPSELGLVYEFWLLTAWSKLESEMY